MFKKLSATALLASAVVSQAMAQTAPADPLAGLDAGQTKIDGIWGWVATIIIGSAVLTVAARFFRKAK